MMINIIHNKLVNIKLTTLYKIVPFAFALHEFEEWNVLLWHQNHQSNIPAVSHIDLRTIFLLLIVICFVVFFTAIQFKNKRIMAHVLFPLLSLMCYNGIVHLYWTFYFSDYSPGLIFGFFMGVPLISLIIYRIMRDNLISKWYGLTFGLLFTALFVEVILLGNKLEPGIVNAMLLGKKLVGWLWY